MGCRNPFRISIDALAGTLYWGDVGPDSIPDSAARGPRGHDEVNRARAPGNYGWPYFIGDNKSYLDYDFATAVSGPPFDPLAPINDSPNNTGARDLPPAEAAWIWYPDVASPEFPEIGEGDRAVMAGPLYRYDPLGADGRFPAYYDNTLFIHDWARHWIKAIRLDAAGDILKIDPFLPGLPMHAPIDLEAGPDGALYLLEWGERTGTAGRLTRIIYRPTRDAPSGIGSELPLRLVKTAGGGARIVLEDAPDETGYVVCENEIGIWYGTPTRTCFDTWATRARPLRSTTCRRREADGSAPPLLTRSASRAVGRTPRGAS